MPSNDHHESKRIASQLSRRRMMQAACGGVGLSLPGLMALQQSASAAGSTTPTGRAKSCIVLFCWGGMSHHETWDPKPKAPKETRGLFSPISTATPGIQIGEHMPHLAKRTGDLAIIRSIHHSCTAHGKGMYWNMTGHAPPAPALAKNLPPSSDDWPSLAAVVQRIKQAPQGIPGAVRLPYPLVDNGTLQAGEYGGWLGAQSDPIVVKTPGGKPFGGVSRDLGSMVLSPADGIDRSRMETRKSLLDRLGQIQADANNAVGTSAAVKQYGHFRELATSLLLSSKVEQAFNLDSEPKKIREAYGDHICGKSILLARRLTEVGVPIVTVCCAAGDLNGSKGDHWDTHGDNFNRLKNAMLPAFDRPAAALLEDLRTSGRLDETLVVFLTEFGRTPKINGGAGRDHYPFAYSVALAGGGIRGGQVYGSSDRIGAYPADLPCGPNDLHATIFKSLGIPAGVQLPDRLGRPMAITDGEALPLF